MKGKICYFILNAVIFFISVNAFSDIYKWTDKQGQVHFSDHPNPDDKHPNTSKATSPSIIDNSSQPQHSFSKEELWAHDVIFLRALREELNNPDSFQLVQVIRLDDDTLCVTFRGTNAFNAIMTEHKAISSDGQFLDYEDICSGKVGENITYIKEAL